MTVMVMENHILLKINAKLAKENKFYKKEKLLK